MDNPSTPSLTIAGVGIPYSLISLLTLTVQNSALAILLHYSRTAPSAKPYSAPAAVLLNELLKGLICFGIALNNVGSTTTAPAEERMGKIETPRRASGHGTKLSMSVGRQRAPSLQQDQISKLKAADGRAQEAVSIATSRWWISQGQWRYRMSRVLAQCASPDCWKLAVPACCYVLQNNLQFIAASNLDVATFQVVYQAKILTTAFFSVTILRKKLSTTKWLCLVALAIGVAVVQLQDSSDSSNHGEGSKNMDKTTGFVAIIMACMTSGFAGVWFEKVLKGAVADLWIRNIQLTLFSLGPAFLAALFPNASLRSLWDQTAPSTTKSLDIDVPTWIFENFGFWAIATVVCQVCGGLVTALVIRYSDNIAKGFATSLSIIISFAAGVLLFDFQVTRQFLLGCTIVLAATYCYNQAERAPASLIARPQYQGSSYKAVPSDPDQKADIPIKSLAIPIPATPPRMPRISSGIARSSPARIRSPAQRDTSV